MAASLRAETEIRRLGAVSSSMDSQKGGMSGEAGRGAAMEKVRHGIRHS